MERNAQAVSSMDATSPTVAEINHAEIVISSIKKLNIIKGYRFQGWKYTIIKTKFTVNEELQDVCLDTGCIMSLIDHEFLKA